MKRNFNIYTVSFVDNHGQLRVIEYTVNEDFIVQKEAKIINNVTGNYENGNHSSLYYSSLSIFLNTALNSSGENWVL
jgi:hypothetical protein